MSISAVAATGYSFRGAWVQSTSAVVEAHIPVEVANGIRPVAHKILRVEKRALGTGFLDLVVSP